MRYYDVDAILAEEELIPCTTNFEFAYLSHLNPDLIDSGSDYLPESSRIKMPLWAVDQWASLGYVTLSFPRHLGRKARERLIADPTEINIRKMNERFFLAGRQVIDLMEKHSMLVSEAIRRTPSSTRANRAKLENLQALQSEANNLRRTLCAVYTGTRLAQTLNWALSSVGEDVTAHLSKLSVMETRLFRCCSVAATTQNAWKTYEYAQYLPRATGRIAASDFDSQRNKRPRLQ